MTASNNTYRSRSTAARLLPIQPALPALCLILFSTFGAAQRLELNYTPVSNEDLEAVITQNQSFDLHRAADLLRLRLQPRVTDMRFRDAAHQRLSPQIAEIAVHDAPTLKELHAVLQPVLSFFGREEAYDIILIDAPVPYMMSDSGVLLVISTGMISRARSDDELLGYTAHEVGHEFYVRYSIYTKYLEHLVTENGGEKDLLRHLRGIRSLLELHCDAFSAVTIGTLGYTPIEFINGFQRTEQEYSNIQVSNHPPSAQRRKLVENIIPPLVQAIRPRQTASFRRLQQLVSRLHLKPDTSTEPTTRNLISKPSD